MYIVCTHEWRRFDLSHRFELWTRKRSRSVVHTVSFVERKPSRTRLSLVWYDELGLDVGSVYLRVASHSAQSFV